VVLWLLVAMVVAGCGMGEGSGVSPQVIPQASAQASAHASPSPGRPNIVLVLADDLSTNLVRYMPQVQAMKQHGMTFTNYTVTDSLCCPSRSSLLTGNYPHDTGVFTNLAPNGGYSVFRRRGNETATFAVALHDAGYRTALMGKYLNGYQPGAAPGLPSPAPPGWDEWDGVGNGYGEYGYRIADDGGTSYYDHQPGDYLTSVLQQRATDFIGSSASSGQAFFLEVATFTPHRPFVPAPADATAFPGLKAPRTAAFDRLPKHPPKWLRHRHRLTHHEIHKINVDYRLRARDVLSIDRLITAIYQALSDAGVADETDVIFSSDNGYHMGEYRLNPGKMTAFETDINVPLVATGPGIPAGARNTSIVQNIDLAPTFEALAGLRPDPAMDGKSMVELLHGRTVHGWTTTALVEHRSPDDNPADPDYQQRSSGNPPSYEALRTARYTYVKYLGGGAEFYRRDRDPHELHNVIGQLSSARRAQLRLRLHSLRRCNGVTACTAARTAP
jgi:arylsulfatase A-like enzyme